MDGVEYKEMVRRIQNWRMVMRDSMRASTCGSAEKHWRAPRPEDVRESPVVLFQADAELIEKAWRSLMPVRSKWLIKWHFVMCIPSAAIIRMMQRKHGYGIRHDHFECELRCAVELLKKNVDMKIRAGDSSIQQFDSGHRRVYGCQQASLSRPEETKPALAA